MRTTDHVRRSARRTHRGGHPSNQRAGRVPQRRGEGRLRHQPRPVRRVRGRPEYRSNRVGSMTCQQSHLPTAPRSPTSASEAGRALILVDGAMCYRGAGSDAAARRAAAGRPSPCTPTTGGAGAKARTPCPYAVAREVEDLQALIARAGGAAYVYAHLLRCGARAGRRGGRLRDHQAGALRATVHGRGRGRRPDQGVHRTAPRAARRRAARATRWRCS